MHTPCRKRPQGFSLIELLAALAAIAILAVILVPSINFARKQGLRVQNLANLRSIQSANMLYASDHDGAYLAVGSFDEKGTYGNLWFLNRTFLNDYMGVAASQWPDELLSPLAQSLDAEGRVRVDRSYGYNFTGLGAFGIPSSTRGTTSGRVPHPSRKLAFADAMDWQIQMSGAGRYQGSDDGHNSAIGNNAIAYRYDGRAGVVFFDGHVEMLNRDAVIGNRRLWVIEEE